MKKVFKKTAKKINLRIFFKVGVVLILIAFLVGTFNFFKPLPEDIGFKGSVHYLSEEEIEFLYDLTYSRNGKRVVEQEIFREVFNLIENAEEFILIDFFLFNKDFGNQNHFIDLTSELTNHLIEKKSKTPKIEITLITDPINNFYGSYEAEHLKKLEDAGIKIVITDLTKLRDSNPLYSGFWRSYLQWFGTAGRGWITHPLGNENYKVTLRSMLSVLNAKANHRKVVTADNNGKVVSIITSGNPHNASSLHSNIAFRVEGEIWKDILKTEKAVARFSGSEIELPPRSNYYEDEKKGEISVQLLTERKIRESLIKDINSASKEDNIDMAIFYLSDRKIIRSLLEASKKGVGIRIVLDPNKDAFAREKNGIPNRQVAYELDKKTKGSIKIKWFDTQGEQFHTKMTIINKENGIIVNGGSANLTKRNLGNFNLETNLRVTAPNETEIAQKAKGYFDRIWNNQEGHFTLDFEEKYKETSSAKYWIYRFQEWSGISTF